MLKEHMTVGPVRMEVRVEDWRDGRTGILVGIGDSAFLFTVEGAIRLRDALANQISLARELDEVIPNDKASS